MKKLFLVFAALLLSLLVACGGDDEASQDDTSNNEGTDNTEVDESESSDDEDVEANDNVLETDNAKFVIKDTEIIDSARFDDKKIIAIEVEYTNKKDEQNSPYMAFSFDGKAEQETDSTVELLNGANGQFPDDYKTDLVEMGETDVKSNKTVDAVIGYELVNPDAPVYLRSDEQDFELKVE